MDTLPDIGRLPDYGLTDQPEFRVDTVKLGDGYEQRRPAGINSVRRSWSVTWSLISLAEMQTLRDFLKSKKGVEAFEWTLPIEGETVRVVCKQGASSTFDSFAGHTVSATFVEDFSL